MSRGLARALAGLFVLVAALLARTAHAESALPVAPHMYPPALAPGRAPSPDLPKGTVLVFHLEDVGPTERALAVLEWDVARALVVAKARLGPAPELADVVRATRTEAGIFVAAGHGTIHQDAVLLRISPSLKVETRAALPKGRMPSLDADGPNLVVAIFEHRPPAVPEPWGSKDMRPPTDVLRVERRDPKSLAVTAASTFTGPGGKRLQPAMGPSVAGHAVALHHDELVLALPMTLASHLVTVSLRDLAILSARTIRADGNAAGSVPLVRSGAGVLAAYDDARVAVAGTPARSSPVADALVFGHEAIVAWNVLVRVRAGDDTTPTTLEVSELGDAGGGGGPALRDAR
jgi:hypothetical protein